MVKKHISVKERKPDYKKIIDNFLDDLEVGAGFQLKNLNLYPIYKSTLRKSDLVSLREALEQDIIEIKETGIVGTILVINKSKDKKILLVEGETVKGGAQNRVINTTIIIMPNTQEKIPVSCVQQHRWNTFDEPFKNSEYLSPHTHTLLAKEIHTNLQESFQSTGCYGGKGSACYAGNQGSLWAGADTFLLSANAMDATADIHKAFETKKEDIDEWMKLIQPILDQPIVGIITEIDGNVFADISDTVEFAKDNLNKIVKGFCLDAILSTEKKEVPLDEDRMVDFLETLKNGELIVGDSPNKVGQDLRIKTVDTLSNIFCYKNEIVHWIILKV